MSRLRSILPAGLLGAHDAHANNSNPATHGKWKRFMSIFIHPQRQTRNRGVSE